MNQGMILSTGKPPSIPIAETDGVPFHDPSCVNLVGGFNIFPVGFGGRSGNSLEFDFLSNLRFECRYF